MKSVLYSLSQYSIDKGGYSILVDDAGNEFEQRFTVNPDETLVLSNGSKYLGQRPDTLEKLYEVFDKNTLSIGSGVCPLRENGQDVIDGWIFHGNFNEISHNFNIWTRDREVIDMMFGLMLIQKDTAERTFNHAKV